LPWSDTHSTPATRSAKPNKPYPEFPLYAHAAGVWAKKIRGKVHYLRPWNDPDGALKNYLAQKEDLHADKEPREDTEGLTVKGLTNQPMWWPSSCARRGLPILEGLLLQP
jgi:hypothetical protein